jgi:hypothetical protein
VPNIQIARLHKEGRSRLWQETPTQNCALRDQQVVAQTSETSAAFAQTEEAPMTTMGGQRVEVLKTARIEKEKRAKREP